jgi:hypothetical protein
LQGNVLGKGTGALAIGDSLLKGFMLGHQMKEQRKQQQAETAIAAADAAAEGAYQKYQQNLQNLGPQPAQNDPKYAQWKQQADGFYSDYQGVFNQAKQEKAKYILPDKTQKGKKTAAESGSSTGATGTGGKEKKPASAGFNNIKDFFEANPHIVPQIALLAMQPKPQGLSPQGQEQVQNLESQKLANQQQQAAVADTQRRQAAQKIYDQYSGLNEQEFAALPPETQRMFNSAKNVLFPPRTTGATYLYQKPDGSITRTYPGSEPAGSIPYVPGRDVKPGTPGFYLEQAAKESGKSVNDLSTDEINAAMAKYKAAQVPQTTTTSTSSTTPQGVHESTTTRKASPGGIQRPPTGSQQASPSTGGMTRPPTAQAAPTGQGKQGVQPPPQAAKTAKGGMAPPPISAAVAGAGGGKQTALTAAVTRQAVQKQQEGYGKAEAAYKKTVDDADKAFAAAQKTAATSGDPSILATAQAVRDRDKAQAVIDLEKAKGRVKREFDAAVKSIGGTPGDEGGGSLPPGWQ